MSLIHRPITPRSQLWHERHHKAGRREWLLEYAVPGPPGRPANLLIAARVYDETPEGAVEQFRQRFCCDRRPHCPWTDSTGIELGDVVDENFGYVQLYLESSAITVRNVTEVDDEVFDADGYLLEQQKRPPLPWAEPDAPIVYHGELGWLSARSIARLMDDAGLTHYRMELHVVDAEPVIQAINQGIDAHLEGCSVPARGDSYDWKEEDGIFRLRCRVSRDSLPTLLRRLTEADAAIPENRRAGELVGQIVETLSNLVEEQKDAA